MEMYLVDIRQAQSADAQVIALLGRVTFSETFGHLFTKSQDLQDYLSRTFAVEKLKRSLSNSENIYWVAYLNDLPVGYAKLKLNSSTEFIDSTKTCQLQKIYVLKDFLKMKIGSSLQNVVLKCAKELEFANIWLSVLHTNERAIHFYVKHGFTKSGSHDYSIGSENFHFRVMNRILL